MKYFIDTEFNEGIKQPFFSKAFHTIEFISIGIVAEDGRSYYAISKEFNIKAAWNKHDILPANTSKNHSLNDVYVYWLRDNVLKPMMYEFWHKYQHLQNVHHISNDLTLSNLKKWIAAYGKSNKQIANEIFEFVNPEIKKLIYTFTRHDDWAERWYPAEFKYIRNHNTKIPDHYFQSGINNEGYEKNAALIYNQPEFYGYFADYDWVVFCSLYGKMINLPKGYPMYCRDLKQMIDEALERLYKKENAEQWWLKNGYTKKPSSLKEALHMIKGHSTYPQQEKEHNALADADWNHRLHTFIERL